MASLERCFSWEKGTGFQGKGWKGMKIRHVTCNTLRNHHHGSGHLVERCHSDVNILVVTRL